MNDVTYKEYIRTYAFVTYSGFFHCDVCSRFLNVHRWIHFRDCHRGKLKWNLPPRHLRFTHRPADLTAKVVSFENTRLPNSKHTHDEWNVVGSKLEQRQTPAYCLNCHDYQWNAVPPCNKCRIQTEHDLRTSKLPKAPEHVEEYYDGIIYEERAERVTNGKVGSTSIPKWLAVLPNASFSLFPKKIQKECDM